MKIYDESNKEHVTISLTRYAMLGSSLEDHIEVATRKIDDNNKAHRAEIVKLKFELKAEQEGYVKISRENWHNSALRYGIMSKSDFITKLDLDYDNMLKREIEKNKAANIMKTKELKEMSIWKFLKWRKS